MCKCILHYFIKCIHYCVIIMSTISVLHHLDPHFWSWRKHFLGSISILFSKYFINNRESIKSHDKYYLDSIYSFNYTSKILLWSVQLLNIGYDNLRRKLQKKILLYTTWTWTSRYVDNLWGVCTPYISILGSALGVLSQSLYSIESSVFSLHVSRVWYMSRVYTYMGLELFSA